MTTKDLGRRNSLVEWQFAEQLAAPLAAHFEEKGRLLRILRAPK